MYARNKGVSGSTKPIVVGKFCELKKDEIEKIVVKLKNDGYQQAQIGLIMRDQYGIPDIKRLFGKTVTDILEENKLLPEIPQDLLNLLVKTVNLRDHMEKNKKDQSSKRGLEILESKVRRLGKYYIKTNKLPADWKYNPAQTKLIVQTVK